MAYYQLSQLFPSLYKSTWENFQRMKQRILTTLQALEEKLKARIEEHIQFSTLTQLYQMCLQNEPDINLIQNAQSKYIEIKQNRIHSAFQFREPILLAAVEMQSLESIAETLKKLINTQIFAIDSVNKSVSFKIDDANRTVTYENLKGCTQIMAGLIAPGLQPGQNRIKLKVNTKFVVLGVATKEAFAHSKYVVKNNKQCSYSMSSKGYFEGYQMEDEDMDFSIDFGDEVELEYNTLTKLMVWKNLTKVIRCEQILSVKIDKLYFFYGLKSPNSSIQLQL